MLIDIFARRYESTPLRDTFDQRDSRLLVQAFRILAEDIYPYYRDGKEDTKGVKFWTDIHSRLSRELGLPELSPQYFSYTTKWNGNDVNQTHKHSMVKVCENWMLKQPIESADTHIKDRLSLIELGFRERGVEIAAMNVAPVQVAVPAPSISALPTLRVPGDRSDGIRALRARVTAAFQASVEELNARFKQAHYDLHYHSGFIQASTDDMIQRTVETPFWSLVGGLVWHNVDIDMKEALDLRDSDGRDPAFYAARALESAIKIISGQRGWTHGKERALTTLSTT